MVCMGQLGLGGEGVEVLRGGAGRGGADHPVPIVTARAGPTREKPWILFSCGQVVCVDGPALQASGKSKSVSVFWCRQD